MAGDTNALVSGSPMAVLIGFAAIIVSIVAKDIDLGTSFVLFLTGLVSLG